jgi:hypothetical protein
MEDGCYVDLVLTADPTLADLGVARGFGTLQAFQVRVHFSTILRGMLTWLARRTTPGHRVTSRRTLRESGACTMLSL